MTKVNENVQHRPNVCLLRAGFIALVGGYCVMTLPAQAQWQDADLTVITGGPVATSAPIAMAFDPVQNGMRTHYRSTPDWMGHQHVHELFLSGGQWGDADLTAITGAPASLDGSGIAMAFDPVQNGMRTHYISANRHVHELFFDGTQWRDADLTAITGGPTASNSAFAMAFDPVQNGMRTHYISANGHVHELFLNGTEWQDADLTAITGGPAIFTAALAMAFDPLNNGMRTHYISSEGAGQGHVHELFLNGTRWQDADLTEITGAPLANFYANLAVIFDPVQNGMRTHYRSLLNNHVHELLLSGSQWQDTDLTAVTRGPDTYANLSIAFDPVQNVMRTHYIAANNHVHELSLSEFPAANIDRPGQWQDVDLTAIVTGPQADWAIAITYDPVWNSMRTHYLSYGRNFTDHVHELFLYR